VSVDERRRRELHERLSATVGPEATATMFELLPPEGEAPATHSQVAALSARMDRGFDHLGGRIDRLEHRMDGIEHRMDGWELRLEAQTDRLTAVFRQELLTAVTGQTRAILLTVLTTLLGTATLAVAFAQLV
jgi:hypothetical protein